MHHFVEICEFGQMHSQCRCTFPNKTVKKVSCNMPDKHQALAEKAEEVSKVSDPINPSHYKASASGVECIEVTRDLSFNLGNVVKYLWRLGQKDDSLQEIQKAQWYLRDEIRRVSLRNAWTNTLDVPWRVRYEKHINTLEDHQLAMVHQLIVVACMERSHSVLSLAEKALVGLELSLRGE